jgi:hypothetical protein
MGGRTRIAACAILIARLSASPAVAADAAAAEPAQRAAAPVASAFGDVPAGAWRLRTGSPCWTENEGPGVPLAWTPRRPTPDARVRLPHVGASARTLAPEKQAWQAALGGAEAVRPLLRQRLAGWPERLLVPREELPADDREFLTRVARDTWRGLAALSDREHGLPIDHVRFDRDSLDPGQATIGDYTSSSSIGLYLAAIVAAHELGLVSRDEALARAERVLATLDRLETHRGVFFNFYDTTTLERTSEFLSFVDSVWLTAGFMVLRQSFPELEPVASRMIRQRNYGFFYDPEHKLMSHGYYVDIEAYSAYHYATLYTEARLGSLIAIGKGEVPEEHWFRMIRTFPASCDWQSLPPQGRATKRVRGFEFAGGWYEWKGLRYVPSWGGSMFEALMPALLLDERAVAPRSLGRNAEVHAEIQRRYALEDLGQPVWGQSPAANPKPNGYGEYGVRVLGALGYEDSAVTPHASALALGFQPEAAVANLRRMLELYDVYGEYGFYDSLDPRSGEVGYVYLALDQEMMLIAIANHLAGGVLQQRFAADPIAARALPLLAEEDFLD